MTLVINKELDISRLGFSAKTNDSGKTIDGISVFEDYDGEGEERVMFYKTLDKMEKA